MTSGSTKVSARVYPWHDLAWDLALADGMDPAQLESRFESKTNEVRYLKSQKMMSDKQDSQELVRFKFQWPKRMKAKEKLDGIAAEEQQWQEATSIQDDINTDISTHLWRDILEGKVPVRKANGNPLRGESKQFKWRGPDTPHLTAAEGNEWLTKNRYLQVWEPGDLKKPKDVLGVAVEAASGVATVATEPVSSPANTVCALGDDEPTKEIYIDKGYVYKKRVLIGKLKSRWPTIENDFQHYNNNGLGAAAKATGHGDWFENAALNWARKHGKLQDEMLEQPGPVNTIFGQPGRRIKGV